MTEHLFPIYMTLPILGIAFGTIYGVMRLMGHKINFVSKNV